MEFCHLQLYFVILTLATLNVRKLCNVLWCLWLGILVDKHISEGIDFVLFKISVKSNHNLYFFLEAKPKKALQTFFPPKVKLCKLATRIIPFNHCFVSKIKEITWDKKILMRFIDLVNKKKLASLNVPTN